MNFERGLGVTDATGIGVKNDALKIQSVTYTINGTSTTISDSITLKRFLKAFQDLDIPNDPIFGPQRITMDVTGTQVETHVRHTRNSKYVTKAIPDITIAINQIVDKTMEYDGEYYAMPSVEDLAKKGFGHFADYELEHVKKIESDHEMMKRKVEAQRKMRQAEYEANLAQREAEIHAAQIHIDAQAKSDKEKMARKKKLKEKLNPMKW